MSLARHVTATEGVDREEPLEDYVSESGDSLAWRRLSYDAFQAVEHTEVGKGEDPTPHIASYKTSTARRAAQVLFGVVACCFASGIVFGFASLKPVLIAEGVYGELCGQADTSDIDRTEPCPKQDIRLNLFFIAASITTNVSSLLAGTILDQYGRRICYNFACLFLAIGCVLMGYPSSSPDFDSYLFGNVSLGLGGTFLFLPSFQLANAFPMHSGLITALVTGAFDGSAAVFLFYRLAWEVSGGAFKPSQFFLGYLVVPLVILVGEWTLMPKGAYFTMPELESKIEKAQDVARDVHDSDQDLDDAELFRVRSNRAERRMAKLDQIETVAGDAEVRDQRAKDEVERHVVSGIWGVLHGLPAWKQMLTPWFVLLLLLTILQMIRMNYFIATIREQYHFLLGSEKHAEAINEFFDIALPVGGVAATPFIGLMLNKLSVATTLALLTGFIAAIGVLNCLPYVWAGYATVVCFVLFRPLYYSAVSDYATKVFGFATFGRIYGTMVSISGLVNFVQSGLDALTHGPLGGDPTWINVFMLVIGTGLGVALTAFVYLKGRGFREVMRRESLIEQIPTRLPLIREESYYSTNSMYGTV